jgi:hypothetical protein
VERLAQAECLEWLQVHLLECVVLVVPEFALNLLTLKFFKHTMAENNSNGNPGAGGSGLTNKTSHSNNSLFKAMMALLNWQIQANTNITMKTEVIKLLDFYREPNKDTIMALEFMARIEECQITNEWNDIMTFSYFWLELHGQADKWLSSIVRHLQLTAAQKI